MSSAFPNRRFALAAAAALLAAPILASAQAKGEIRIAHVYSKSGPLVQRNFLNIRTPASLPILMPAFSKAWM